MSSDPLNRRKFLKTVAISALTAGFSGKLAYADQLFDLKTKKIPHRPLGNTGAHIPILQLGTAQGMDQEYDKIMHQCFREGVYYIDTALSYGWGRSQKAIANFVSQIGDRRKVWITSKSSAWTIKGFVNDIDKCLHDLKTDYLDLYFKHSVSDEDDINQELAKVGEKLKKSGKTRYFGFSTHGGDIPEILQKAVKVGGIDAILFRYNFRTYGERALNLAIDACHRAGIGLIAMKTYGAVESDDKNVIKFKSQNFTLGQAKLKSVWADERIASICSEMDSVRVARENIAAAKSEKHLSATEVHQLNNLAARTANEACLGCSQHCEKAINHQVRIADCLRFLMYHQAYGNRDKAKSLYQDIPNNKRLLEPTLSKIAENSCPQGIDIKNKLLLAKSILS
jgi:uncharacterized protein